MLLRWGNHPALIGFEPVNEPWKYTDLRVLKILYRDVRKMMQRLAPDKYFVFHDSFRPLYEHWDDLFDGNDTNLTAVDHHPYVAWKFLPTVDEVCNYQLVKNFAYAEDFRKNGIEVWIGEWSLATDNCAMWLEGFNDGKNGTGVNATCKAL